MTWDAANVEWEASPHTRGWTPDIALVKYKKLGLPRTRGDGPVPNDATASDIEASPHTRGWTPVPLP